MIEARGLVKRYGSTMAVSDLSFSIRPGLVTGFLGPNGAGKTTTMRMILGLDPDGIHWVRTLMRTLAAEGRTVLVSSHLMSEMALTADHLLVIGKGRLIADTSVDEFVRSSSQQSVHVRSPQAAELAARCREAGAAVQAGTGPDVIEITGMDSAEVGRLAAAHGIVLFELIPSRPR